MSTCGSRFAGHTLAATAAVHVRCACGWVRAVEIEHLTVAGVAEALQAAHDEHQVQLAANDRPHG